MNPSVPRSAPPQKSNPSLENSTIEKQRQELQLLIAELKDRDKELDDMVAVHQRQLLVWEDDRQKILTLAERCNLLSNELNKRNEIIKSLTRRLKFLESQQSDSKTTLESTQQKFRELSQKVTDATAHCQALEEKNQGLHCSVLELSAKTGQLQAREQELLTMLKLKDEAILETTDHITDFTSKFKKVESALRAARMERFSLNKDKQDLKLRLKELVLETNKLKVEKAKRQDQLLQFAKSKQARTDTELSGLRKIYVKQQRDLQFLHVNLESSQELRQKHEKAAHERSVGMAFSAPESNSKTDTVRTEGTHGICEECGTAQVPKSGVKPTSEMCEVDNGLLQNASDMEETTSAYLNQCPKVVKVLADLTEEEKQDVASSSGEPGSQVFCEANNTRPLRNREISENEVEIRDQQTFESSSPEHEHWLNVNSCVHLQSTFVQSTVTFAQTANENETWEERTGILLDQKSRETPAAVHRSESDSCSSKFFIKKDAWWKPVSDPEWLKIFKPIKGDGNVWHGKDCSCLRTAQEMKCACSKSGENVDLNSFHLDSPCLTSTQKGDRPQRCEKFCDEEFTLEINSFSVTEPTNRCCTATVDRDTSSPISKLQHALAESRQMVADLELSTLLQASPRCSPNSSNINTTTEVAEGLHRTQLSAAEERGADLPFFSL
ncbi:coiled-coil domain-containing protein 62 isoform X2 [Pezoporus flaviventris]|uniref:coiled-coil domain-containing protein 62 isoform X2 n=1 Tax=Pezoporus flaviventris TaxID=889875 RepID=UPI002AAF5CB2|nr:coiled-coil domain-containing protein 62 isoform X2 [Pezoporus flaviventris]